ncbi:hypothetical protein GCM10023340_02600 [Nocardioides marinquilinus]|uniref:Beta-lactamase-related domain-containing protein n=1 Tax=Nocardioides marinquilinus TaxID=1210400 RepID=A0ABP9P607_9ACTN
MRRTTRWTAATALALSMGATGLGVPATAAPGTSAAAPAAAVSPGASRIEGGDLRRAMRAVTRAGGVGVVVHVVRDGEVWKGASGVARVGAGRPASPKARFRAASVTKQLTAVLALQRVARGEWTMRTRLRDVLPGLWPARGGVTLRQLLSHTAGLPDYAVALTADATTIPKFKRAIGQRRTDRGLVRVAKRLPAPKVGRYSYSNTGFVLVGMMLERQTGRSLPSLMRREVLRPAGMTRSRFARDKRMARPLLREYGDFGLRHPVDLTGFSPTTFSAAGALISTAGDLNRFQLALSRGRLLPKRLVRAMRSVVAADEATGLQYGLGSYRLPDPCAPADGWVFGHDGLSFGTATLSFASDDGRRRVTVAMTGREYTRDQPAYLALQRLFGTALGETCRGPRPPTPPISPAPDRGAVAPRLVG